MSALALLLIEHVHDRTAPSEDFGPAARIAGRAALCSIPHSGTRGCRNSGAAGFKPEFS
jgi:hypothetical protein